MNTLNIDKNKNTQKTLEANAKLSDILPPKEWASFVKSDFVVIA